MYLVIFWYCTSISFIILNIFKFVNSLFYEGMAMKSTSMSTRFLNGKKVTTKKEVENGVETVTTYENDVLKSQTVNGVPQAIQVQHTQDYLFVSRSLYIMNIDLLLYSERVYRSFFLRMLNIECRNTLYIICTYIVYCKSFSEPYFCLYM